MPSVLFVCTGNIHRSPMAEHLFRQLVKDRLGNAADWQIDSAGTYTRNGMRTTAEVLTVLQNYGLDASTHRSREINRRQIRNHNVVLCMAGNHKEALRAEFPDLAGRIYLLSEMAGETADIDDPIGGPLVEFETTAREIDAYLRRGFERIVALAGD